jgi:hypothetical protein
MTDTDKILEKSDTKSQPNKKSPTDKSENSTFPWEQFPGKAHEDDLDETDRGFFTQEEIRNSIHRF